MHRLIVEGHPDWPIPLEIFLQQGKYKGDYVGILHYDEVFGLVRTLGDALMPFYCADPFVPTAPDDEVIVLPVRLRDLRRVQSLFKKVKLPPGSV